MSGVITPLIDTLLHEVLGKRADATSARPLFEPVKPLVSGQAPRAAQGDSRLDPRQGVIARANSGLEEGAQRSPVATPAPTPGASATTHFSPAARSIADLLLKFPAPRASLQAPAPLLVPAESGQAVQPRLLAARLQHSIDFSGLFYESHLARWYRGEIPRAILARHPQMQLSLPGAELSMPAAGPPTLGSAAESTAQRPSTQRLILTPLPSQAPPMPLTAQPVEAVRAFPEQIALTWTALQREAPLETLMTHKATGADAPDETLQGILRHQLELLVTPTLRWEGEPWAGVFMALVIHLPEALAQRQEQEQGQGGEDDTDDAPVWHSEFRLKLANLGDIEVRLQVEPATLHLTLQSDNTFTALQLKTRREALSERLYRCGFETVRIDVTERPFSDKASPGETP